MANGPNVFGEMEIDICGYGQSLEGMSLLVISKTISNENLFLLRLLTDLD